MVDVLKIRAFLLQLGNSFLVLRNHASNGQRSFGSVLVPMSYESPHGCVSLEQAVAMPSSKGPRVGGRSLKISRN